MAIPCCMGRMAYLADACADAQVKYEAFDRLSKKTGDPKYDKQRAAALSNAQYWLNQVNACKIQQATQTAQAQQEAIQKTVAAVAPSESGFDTGKLLVYGGAAVGAALLLYLVLRRRG